MLYYLFMYSFVKGGTDEVRELEEDKCGGRGPGESALGPADDSPSHLSLCARVHLFLEKRGETLTVKDLRDRAWCWAVRASPLSAGSRLIQG